MRPEQHKLRALFCEYAVHQMKGCHDTMTNGVASDCKLSGNADAVSCPPL